MTFTSVPPFIKIRCAVSCISASTSSINFFDWIACLSSDSNTGRRVCASSRVKERSDMVWNYSNAFARRRWSFAVARSRGAGARAPLPIRAEPGRPHRGFSLTTATNDYRPQPTTLPNLQHPIQRHPRPLLHPCLDLDRVEGNVVNEIKVKDGVKKWARVALDRMLEIR